MYPTFFYINRNVHICLNCIRMEINIILFGYLSNLVYRLNRSYLIVGIHYRNQNCIISYCPLKIPKRNPTPLINRKISHSVSLFFKCFAGIEDCMMLNTACYDMPSSFSFISARSHRSKQCPVVTLRATTCKINFIFRCIYTLCHLLSGCLYFFLTLLCKFICPRWISIINFQTFFHLSNRPWTYRSRCRMVKINHTAPLHPYIKSIYSV